jgi:hypothetical protein
MQSSVLTVVRSGDLWGVKADGELLALARTKQGAHDLARDAARILRQSGGEARVEAARERRSFKRED